MSRVSLLAEELHDKPTVDDGRGSRNELFTLAPIWLSEGGVTQEATDTHMHGAAHVAAQTKTTVSQTNGRISSLLSPVPTTAALTQSLLASLGSMPMHQRNGSSYVGTSDDVAAQPTRATTEPVGAEPTLAMQLAEVQELSAQLRAAHSLLEDGRRALSVRQQQLSYACAELRELTPVLTTVLGSYVQRHRGGTGVHPGTGSHDHSQQPPDADIDAAMAGLERALLNRCRGTVTRSSPRSALASATKATSPSRSVRFAGETRSLDGSSVTGTGTRGTVTTRTSTRATALPSPTRSPGRRPPPAPRSPVAPITSETVPSSSAFRHSLRLAGVHPEAEAPDSVQVHSRPQTLARAQEHSSAGRKRGDLLSAIVADAVGSIEATDVDTLVDARYTTVDPIFRHATQ